MSAQPHPRLTPEQYLEIDRASEFKSEYYDGEIYAMAGGTPLHALITANIGGELRERLKGSPCRVYSPDLRIRVSVRTYAYPDVAVVCGEAELAHLDTVVNPVVLIEVLSPSTEALDRGMKSARYRKLESLKEYGFVSQSEPRVEILRKQADGRWLLSEFIGLDTTCRFESVGCSIPLAEIYRDVTFAPDEPEQPQA